MGKIIEKKESPREYITRRKKEEAKRFEEEAYHKERTLAEVEEAFKRSQIELLEEMISEAEKLDTANIKGWTHMQDRHFYRIEAMVDAYKIIFGYHHHRDITNTDDMDYGGLDPEAAKKIMEGLK